jgi:hypothetical protein
MENPTTARQYSGLMQIAAALDRASTWWRSLMIAEGIAVWIATSVTLFLSVVLIAGVFTPPSSIRWLLLIALIACPIAGCIWYVLRPAVRKLSEEEVARSIEQARSDLNNALINAVQLSDDNLAEPEYVNKAISESADMARTVEVRAAFPVKKLQRWSILLLVSLGVLAGFRGFFPQTFGDGVQRIFQPSAFVPIRGKFEIMSVEPGDEHLGGAIRQRDTQDKKPQRPERSTGAGYQKGRGTIGTA